MLTGILLSLGFLPQAVSAGPVRVPLIARWPHALRKAIEKANA